MASGEWTQITSTSAGGFVTEDNYELTCRSALSEERKTNLLHAINEVRRPGIRDATMYLDPICRLVCKYAVDNRCSINCNKASVFGLPPCFKSLASPGADVDPSV